MQDWRKKKAFRPGLIEWVEGNRWGPGPIQERTLMVHAEDARLRTHERSMEEVAKNRAKRNSSSASVNDQSL